MTTPWTNRMTVGDLCDALNGAASDATVLVAAGEYLMPLTEVTAVDAGGNRTVYVVGSYPDEPIDGAAIRAVMGWNE